MVFAVNITTPGNYTLYFSTDNATYSDGTSLIEVGNSKINFPATNNWEIIYSITFVTLYPNTLAIITVKAINAGGPGGFAAKILNASNAEVWNSRMTNYAIVV